MKIRDLLFNKKKNVNDNTVKIKYSRLDCIGKTREIPIVQKETLDNLQTQVEQLKEKLDRIPDKLINQIMDTDSSWYEEKRIIINGSLNDISEFEIVKLNNRNYVNFTFSTYNHTKKITVDNLKRFGSMNYIKITLEKITGGGTTGVGTYIIDNINRVLYRNNFTSNSYRSDINFSFPRSALEEQKFLHYLSNRYYPNPVNLTKEQFFKQFEIHFIVEVHNSIQGYKSS